MAWLYRRVLKPRELPKEALDQLASLLCSVEVKAPDKAKGRIAVVHARLKGEKIYAMQGGKACVDLYSRMDQVFWEDESGGRELLNGKASMTPLFADPGEEFEKEILGLAEGRNGPGPCGHGSRRPAGLSGKRGGQHDRGGGTVSGKGIRKENCGSPCSGISKSRIAPRDLSLLLGRLNPEDIEPGDRTEIVRYLTLQGMYEKAYEWQKTVGSG